MQSHAHASLEKPDYTEITELFMKQLANYYNFFAGKITTII
jgi:hypothetical protein